MTDRKTWLGLAVLVALCACVYGYWVAKARPMLDESTYLRRAFVAPWDNTTSEKRFYSIDHPAFARYVWRGAFGVTGWHWAEFDDAHYEFRPEAPLYPANIHLFGPERELAPREPVYVLRAVSAVFMTATCVVLFLMAVRLFGSALAGLALAVPFLVHPAVGQWMIGYPGEDAMLLFWMAAFLALWVGFHVKGTALATRQALILALAAGLAAATKINAGLLAVAFVLYIVTYGRGARRWALAVAFCGLAFGVFVAANPVLWQPGAGGPVQGLLDVFARRSAVMEEQERYLNPLAPHVYFTARLVFLPIAAVGAVLLYKARRAAWLAPVAIWAVTVGCGSYAMLNRYDLRLAMPMDMVVIVTGVLAAATVMAERAKARRSAAPGAAQ